MNLLFNKLVNLNLLPITIVYQKISSKKQTNKKKKKKKKKKIYIYIYIYIYNIDYNKLFDLE